MARPDAAGALRSGTAMTTAILHMITSMESYVELRRHGGLSSDTTVTSLQEPASTLLR